MSISKSSVLADFLKDKLKSWVISTYLLSFLFWNKLILIELLFKLVKFEPKIKVIYDKLDYYNPIWVALVITVVLPILDTSVKAYKEVFKNIQSKLLCFMFKGRYLDKKDSYALIEKFDTLFEKYTNSDKENREKTKVLQEKNEELSERIVLKVETISKLRGSIDVSDERINKMEKEYEKLKISNEELRKGKMELVAFVENHNHLEKVFVKSNSLHSEWNPLYEKVEKIIEVLYENLDNEFKLSDDQRRSEILTQVELNINKLMLTLNDYNQNLSLLRKDVLNYDLSEQQIFDFDKLLE